MKFNLQSLLFASLPLTSTCQPAVVDSIHDKATQAQPIKNPNSESNPKIPPLVEEDSTQYAHFVAHNQTQTCTSDTHALPFNNQIRGVNLGGWMVLEPWITPSLFYQFLGKDENTTATDIHSFCRVLGPEEGNKQLRRHWDTWVTQDIIVELAQSGAVNSLRLPVGDWMYKPYGPYIGCTDGALDYVDLLLDWALANGLSVLLDIHGMKGSQNGFDNSGQSEGFAWTSKLNTVPAGDVTFEHWPIRSAGWIGTFDPVTATYTDINKENIQHGLDVIQAIVDRYHGHPAVLGLEPMNEPWQYTPIQELKKFYWEGYLIVKQSAPYWKYIMHDSFRLDPNVWAGFMAGCPERALDTHIYQAWSDPSSRETFYSRACGTKSIIAYMEKVFGPVVVGEWSLATDNCAMWLNGFNDNLPGFPRLPCKYIPCADPYMGFDQPGTPVDPGKPAQGPFGTGMSGPIFGLCPVGRDWLVESKRGSGTDWMRAPPDAPAGRDASDEVMRNLALKTINSFSGYGHGFYFWNFRTDLDEPHWSYMAALKKGWIPNGNLKDDEITNSCVKEDNGLYHCFAKRGQLDKNIRHGIGYVFNATQIDYKSFGLNTTSTATALALVANMTGEELYHLADEVYDQYWSTHRVHGGTCDFGGTGELVEMRSNSTATNSTKSKIVQTEEENEQLEQEIRLLVVIGFMTLALIFGGIIGFCCAIRSSKQFKIDVAKSKFGKSLSRNKFLNRSFGGLDIDNYEQIPTSSYQHGRSFS